ncbi:nucleotide-diphospho-sugar transferase [Syncephalis plumigaleata]|nr:nucleotide-diphospho-sugar transferase [Syncephalis plumigaleata]
MMHDGVISRYIAVSCAQLIFYILLFHTFTIRAIMMSTKKPSNGDGNLKCAWATLLTRDTYLDGTRVLYRSLQDSSTRYPLVVLYTDTLSQASVDCLRRDGAPVKRIELITDNDMPLPKADDYLWSHYQDIWTKLRVWQLTEYDRVCFLDSDMVVLRNMDEVFDMEIGGATGFDIAAAHACTCNPLKIKGYPSTWTPDNCAFSRQRNVPADEQASSSGLHVTYFNTGFIVLAPSENEFQSILNTARKITDLRSLRFVDQDLLNIHFKDRIKSMPYIYNALKTLRGCHADIWNDDDVKCVHYILEKPWSIERNDPEIRKQPFGTLYNLWWKVHDKLLSEDSIKC